MKKIEEICDDVIEFVGYVYEFYGKGGVYDMGATGDQILKATKLCWVKFGIENFCGDTVDRERVRDIMIDEFGLVFPN